MNKPELTDSRRLTGANLYWDLPAAVIDCRSKGPLDGFIFAWEAAARNLLTAVGHAGQRLTHRVFEGGASLLISAPIDALYSMCELNEVAFACAQAKAGHGTRAPDLAAEAHRLRVLFAEEANPPLLVLQRTAHEHGVPFLWDDDAVSIGYGASARVWTPRALPDPGAVDWAAAHDIPVALVTGTNGKSTTVRMAAAIAAAAGRTAGLTSTDWIRVGETILDTGDYSGTGGARALLRHPETELAVLETARGGLLRRGLGVDHASAAVITNVAADHLGEYGINTVPELVAAKFIVRRALHGDAPLILNAEDSGIVEFATGLEQRKFWFSLDPDREPVRTHVLSGGSAAVLQDGRLVLVDGPGQQAVIDVAEIPATLGGAARHNVRNALAAMALCHVLGIDTRHLRAGLAAFRGDEHDNPGRSNWFERDGIRILVDFAHNPHGMRALAEMLAPLPAQRRVMLLSQAGDRFDDDIRELTTVACGMQPDRLLICDLPGYERGREPGAVPAVIRQAALDAGVPRNAVEYLPTPRAAVAAALADARPGDLLILLTLTQREEILQLIHAFVEAGP